MKIDIVRRLFRRERTSVMPTKKANKVRALVSSASTWRKNSGQKISQQIIEHMMSVRAKEETSRTKEFVNELKDTWHLRVRRGLKMNDVSRTFSKIILQSSTEGFLNTSNLFRRLLTHWRHVKWAHYCLALCLADEKVKNELHMKQSHQPVASV